MRKVNYTVETKDGIKFNTTSYNKATEYGNRIRATFLTPVSDLTEANLEKMRKHVKKASEYRQKKRK